MKFLSYARASAAVPSPCRPLPERLREAADTVEELAARMNRSLGTALKWDSVRSTYMKGKKAPKPD